VKRSGGVPARAEERRGAGACPAAGQAPRGQPLLFLAVLRGRALDDRVLLLLLCLFLLRVVAFGHSVLLALSVGDLEVILHEGQARSSSTRPEKRRKDSRDFLEARRPIRFQSQAPFMVRCRRFASSQSER